MREQLAPKQVKSYVKARVGLGKVEYNNGAILVRSQHPIDECLRRGIIDEPEFECAKRVRTYRDCALSKLSGRIYNAPGEGDSEMDAGTIYAIVMRRMGSTPGGRKQWKLIGIICFAEPNIVGGYFSEMDYAFSSQSRLTSGRLLKRRTMRSPRRGRN
jgi:hypothetical protein